MIFSGFARAEARFLQQRRRLLLREREVEVLGIAGRVVRGRHGDRLRRAIIEGLRDRLLVDGVMRGEAHPVIGEAAILRDLQQHDVRDGVDAGAEARDRGKAGGLADRHVDGHVDALGFDRRDAGGGVAHELDGHARNGGLAAPIGVMRLKTRCARPAGIRPACRGPSRSASSGTRPGRPSRYRPSARRSWSRKYIHATAEGIGSVKCITTRVGETISMSLTRRQMKAVSSLRPPSGNRQARTVEERELEVLGCHLRAVVEHDVGAQVEAEGEALVVDIAPLGDERGLGRDVGVLRDRLVEDHLVERLHGCERTGIRIPGRHVGREGHGELALGRGLREHLVGNAERGESARGCPELQE